MKDNTLELLKSIAQAITTQFGSNCEVVVHDLTSGDPENTICYIENGHVSNRATGGGPSHVVLDAMRPGKHELKDQYNYLTKTRDGRMLRSGTVYIKDDNGKPIGIFSINYDLTPLMMSQNAIGSILQSTKTSDEAEKIPTNVNELLDDLIERSVALVGKPVALMNKDDKVRAINYLNDMGAMLITKSGDKISNYFGISKYTLYSYLNMNNLN